MVYIESKHMVCLGIYAFGIHDLLAFRAHPSVIVAHCWFQSCNPFIRLLDLVWHWRYCFWWCSQGLTWFTTPPPSHIMVSKKNRNMTEEEQWKIAQTYWHTILMLPNAGFWIIKNIQTFSQCIHVTMIQEFFVKPVLNSHLTLRQPIIQEGVTNTDICMGEKSSPAFCGTEGMPVFKPVSPGLR